MLMFQRNQVSIKKLEKRKKSVLLTNETTKKLAN